MIDITQDIHSLTDFKKNTIDFVHALKKSGRPTILTVNGKAELVVMDAAAYQKLQEQLEFEKTVVQINQSLRDFEEEKFCLADKVFSGLRHKINKVKTSPKQIRHKNVTKKL